MESESLARTHVQVVVRTSKGLKFLKVSRKFHDTNLRYRATNMSTVPYIRVVGAYLKSAVCMVRESSPNFQKVVKTFSF